MVKISFHYALLFASYTPYDLVSPLQHLVMLLCSSTT